MWEDILLFAVVSLLAQLVDGIAGMAHGLTAPSFLLSVGVTRRGPARPLTLGVVISLLALPGLITAL